MEITRSIRQNNGVGLRRGRTNLATINTGDSVDFWRVLYADKDEGRLLLFAEMKLPVRLGLNLKLWVIKLSKQRLSDHLVY